MSHHHKNLVRAARETSCQIDTQIESPSVMNSHDVQSYAQSRKDLKNSYFERSGSFLHPTVEQGIPGKQIWGGGSGGGGYQAFVWGWPETAWEIMLWVGHLARGTDVPQMCIRKVSKRKFIFSVFYCDLQIMYAIDHNRMNHVLCKLWLNEPDF